MITMRSLIAETVQAARPPVPVPAPTPVLVAIRAERHPGLDRLVFEFRDGLPVRRSGTYVKRLVADGSGQDVRVAGDAILLLRFAGADGHDALGVPSYGPARTTYALPGIIQVVNTGDFESVLSFGIGLAKRVPYRMYTLKSPSRVVVDFSTPYWTVNAGIRLLDSTGHPRTVFRPVIPPGVARGALVRLFAGPTATEQAAGLWLVRSHATGFSKLTISRGVARVYLTGRVRGDGSTFTIADEIMLTLKRFPTICWVKIYDASGRTQRPKGRTDSIPECLEP
ncbi:hypothetical protein GCM10009555_038610 [Acrocarpospora macrocephala]|uniref:AMIN-like domain-containing protein n=2 Tax=Acrocarpospora macrocephala TaxID=150177 RepID=A0A5M3WKK3_9ACTN|nr:hypothetical protein [Acrocarpospora macrocephala]GES09747.1 hypothetical protein Amac_033430 [Acrocarpospora macrocephala]